MSTTPPKEITEMISLLETADELNLQAEKSQKALEEMIVILAEISGKIKESEKQHAKNHEH